MHKHLTFLISVLLIGALSCPAQQHVFTEDIDRFWVAYDSAKTTNDSLHQISCIQTLYLDKATPGLKAFMAARNYNAERYVQLIRKYPRFWSSIRSHTLTVKGQSAKIEQGIGQLKSLYPELKEAKMYFTIGGLRSGGTTTGNMVLIGAEIATGDSTVDVSEFSNKWLADVFKTSAADNIVSLNVHEYVHTQQQGESDNLLGQAIKEGSCDFIAELATRHPMKSGYIVYGQQHRAELKEEFKKDMYTTAWSRWLYQGSSEKTVADLGYFMGYDICQSYYQKAKNKKTAIREIIELNYSDTSALDAFLKRSGYYTEPIDKQALMQAFKQKQPRLLQITPLTKDDSTLSAETKQITFVFSQPMGKGYSINYGPKGKTASPVTGVIGYSEDHTRFTVSVALEAGHEYEFVITDRSFASAEGYSIAQEYLIRFKTKP